MSVFFLIPSSVLLSMDFCIESKMLLLLFSVIKFIFFYHIPLIYSSLPLLNYHDYFLLNAIILLTFIILESSIVFLFNSDKFLFMFSKLLLDSKFLYFLLLEGVIILIKLLLLCRLLLCIFRRGALRLNCFFLPILWFWCSYDLLFIILFISLSLDFKLNLVIPQCNFCCSFLDMILILRIFLIPSCLGESLFWFRNFQYLTVLFLSSIIISIILTFKVYI